MMTAPHPRLWTMLPAGGWQLGFWADVDGRTQLDVLDATGTLVYRAAAPAEQSSRTPPSIDGAWTGTSPRTKPDGQPRCWALAVGHTPDGILHAVSFVDASRDPRRERGAYPWDAMSGLRVTEDGLWVAAAVGRFTHVRLVAQSTDLLCPLYRVKAASSVLPGGAAREPTRGAFRLLATHRKPCIFGGY